MVPDALTKVCLRCEEAANAEVLVLNDKYLFPDVDIDNVLVKSNNGDFCVYAKSNNGMSVHIHPGTIFCDVVIMRH